MRKINVFLPFVLALACIRPISVCSSYKNEKNEIICRQRYCPIQKGTLHQSSFRMYIQDNHDVIVSPFHDIPLKVSEDSKSTQVYNMIVEIPRWTNAKMEINLKEKMNPIIQDTNQDDSLRYTSNCFPYKGYLWNYGALPQTWENPDVNDEATGYRGDGDPIDMVEIGGYIHSTGSVIKVKILGVIGLIDEDETDWKLLAIDINDSRANQMNDVDDVEKHMPGMINATVDFYRFYKIPEGKPENEFAFKGKPKDAQFAHELVEEVHGHWKALMGRRFTLHDIDRSCTECDFHSKITPAEAKSVVDTQPDMGPDDPIPASANLYNYCKET